MASSGRIAIQRSKFKIALLLLLACGFVASGVWIVGLDDAAIEAQRRYNSPFMVHAVGVFTIVFCGVGAVYSLLKLFDSTPGLVIDEAGITDNSSALSAGFIPWSEIVGVTVGKVQRHNFVYIQIREPDRYLASCGPFKRLMINSGPGISPIAISSISLKIGFDDLASLIKRRVAARCT